MTMQDKTRQALTKNWEQAKQAIRSQFPDLTDDDMASGDPEQVAQRISDRTGQDPAQVARSFDDVAAQYPDSGGGSGQSQTQR